MKLLVVKIYQSFENRYITKEGCSWLKLEHQTSSPNKVIVCAVAKDITEEKKLKRINTRQSW